MFGKKRIKTKAPKNKQDDRSSRTEGGVDIGKSSSSSTCTEVRAAVSLPFQVTVANKVSSIIKFLEKLKASNKEKNDYKHPVIVGSRAAVFWFPSLHACSYWDIVATPQKSNAFIKNEQTNSYIEIKLIKLSLGINAIRRELKPADIKEKLATILKDLYKISGENKNSLMEFEIKITTVEETHSELSSARQLLKMSNNNATDDASYINFSLDADKGRKCIFASIELLEALKSSHIYWPAYFPKHIADLHSLRNLMTPSSSNSIENYGPLTLASLVNLHFQYLL